jgi:hypothetical protein
LWIARQMRETNAMSTNDMSKRSKRAKQKSEVRYLREGDAMFIAFKGGKVLRRDGADWRAIRPGWHATLDSQGKTRVYRDGDYVGIAEPLKG